MEALKLQNVSFAYNGTKNKILENVDFSCNYGEMILFSGKSGEGKSTVMSILSGIIPNLYKGELTGDAFVDGENIHKKTIGQVCQKVGIVLQSADQQIIQYFAEDEIAFGCENLAFSPKKIDEQIKLVCDLFGIDRNSKTKVLSGGQKQTLMTAATIAMGQKIVILDEPLANLDKIATEKLLKTLKALSQAGYCVVIIEHRIDLILNYVDRVFHIEDKKIKEITDFNTYLNDQTRKISDESSNVSTDKPLIVVDHISYIKKKKTILEDISLEIMDGERLVLLGDNGAGKSTLLRSIARLNKISSGKITQNINPKFGNKRASRAWFKEVGIVYQNPDYQLFMETVRKEIEFSGKEKDWNDYIIEVFSLKKLLRRHPFSLSQGQKRRLTIALTLAAKPKLLLLDEPTVGQDYQGLLEIIDILNKVHVETKNTMLTISHDVRCAEAIADRAAIMRAGKIIAQGGKEVIQKYFEFNTEK